VGVFFPPQYTQVDRVICRSIKTAKELREYREREEYIRLTTGKIDAIEEAEKHDALASKVGNASDDFLVKWKDLPYDECTWTTRSKLRDDAAILRYFEIADLRESKPKSRPIVKSKSNEVLNHVTQQVLSMGYKNENQLRNYQIEGVTWLCFNWVNDRSSILADEMVGPVVALLLLYASIYCLFTLFIFASS